MERTYERINWENEPSILTPINAINLNKMDSSIYQIDGRVVEMDTTKAKESDALQMFNAISYDENTGKFTFTRKNGQTVVVDTLLEKVVTNFRYDAETQQLILTTPEGEVRVDMSALITQYEFLDSENIQFVIEGGKVKAKVIAGSITDADLEPQYLANVTAQATLAESSAMRADRDAVLSQSYAVGGTGQREGEESDNAKYYMEQAKAIVGIDIATTEKAGLVKPDGTTITIEADGTIHGAKGEDSTARKAISDNWQGKGYNLIPFPYFQNTRTVNGITFTVNADGSITANGTATAQTDFVVWKYKTVNKFMLSGCPKGGGTGKYILYFSGTSFIDSGNGFLVTNGTSIAEGQNLTIRIYNGQTVNNLIFYPMLVEVAEDGSYPTEYQRYADGNVELSNKAEIESARISDNWNKGGVNLIPYPYYSSNRHISNGITYTVNADGSVTANGTATGASRFYFLSDISNKKIIENGKKYAFFDGVNVANVSIVLAYYNGSTYAGKVEQEKEDVHIFTPATDVTYDRTSCYISIVSGTTVSNLTFKPMLVKVADDGTYPTKYQRYAKGNVELTDTINNVISDAWNSSTTYKVGQYAIHNNTLWRCLVQNVGQTPSEGTYWTAVSVAGELSAETSYKAGDSLNVSTNGAIFLSGRTTGDRGRIFAYWPLSKTIKAQNVTITPDVCRIWSKSGSFISISVTAIVGTVYENGISLDIYTSAQTAANEMCVFEFSGTAVFS